MPSITALARILAMEWSKTIQYRFDAFLWMVSEAAAALVSLALWYAVAQSAHTGPTPTEVLTYYLLVMFVKIATDSWNGAFIAREILDGQIVRDLIRPVPVIWYHITQNLLEKLLKFLIPLPIFVIILITLPQYFSPGIYEINHLILFLISLPIAIVLGFSLETIIGFLAFWLEDVFQIRRYKIMAEGITSGLLIPFAFMPDWLANALNFLPFRYVVATPVEILLGQLEGARAITNIGIQILWVGFLVTISIIMWKKGLKRYAPPGQ